MTSRLRTIIGLALAVCCLLPPALARAQDGMAGWERGGSYDSLYRPDAVTTLSGSVVDVREAAPLPGMAPGPVVTVRTGAGELAAVQTGPSVFAKLLVHALHAGDRVKVRGVHAEVGGARVFLAAKIRVNGAYEFKCRRTRDGVPYWSLSKEALIREKLK